MRIADSIRLGIDAEKDHEEMKDSIPELTEQQIEWLGSWLEGEGYKKESQ